MNQIAPRPDRREGEQPYSRTDDPALSLVHSCALQRLTYVYPALP
jgi:hypothetical protein